MSRLRLAQLHRSGALEGQVPVWDDSAGAWVPGDGAASAATACRATLVAGGYEDGLELGVEPVAGSERVFLNGQLLTWGVDYTISGSLVTFTDALTAADRVTFWYDADGSCGTAELTGGFDPGEVTGVVLWLAADAITGLADGDPVSAWEDLSAEGNDAGQATSGNRPTYQTAEVNGLPVVRFDGSNDYMDCLTLTGSPAAVTMIAVVKPTGSGYRTIVGAHTDGGLQWRIDSSTNYQTLNKQFTAAVGTSTGAVGSAFHVVSASFAAGASYAFELDGVASGSGSHAQTLTSGRTFRIGSRNAAEFLSGDLAELIVYDSVLSGPDLDSVTAYLQAKYAL